MTHSYSAFGGVDQPRYGFFLHFLNDRYGRDLKAWNKAVDEFPVERLADQFAEIGAQWVFLTLGQNGGLYCTPNKTLERICGFPCCSDRDLAADFSTALRKQGIRLMIYSTAMAAFKALDEAEKLKGVPPWDCSMHCRPYSEVKHLAVQDSRLREFQEMWNEIHREWAARWGNSIGGWWIDGCFFPDKLHDFPDAPNGHSFAAALRAGNRDAEVAFNSGVWYPPCRNYAGSPESYTAGENDDPEIAVLPRTDFPIRYHLLGFAGTNWGKYPIRYDGKRLAEITRAVNDQGGCMTWDLPFDYGKGLEESAMTVLREFAACYRQSYGKMPETVISDHGGNLHISTAAPVDLVLRHGGFTENIPACTEFDYMPDFSADEVVHDESSIYLELVADGFKRRVFFPVSLDLRNNREAAIIFPSNGKLKLSRTQGAFRVVIEANDPDFSGNAEFPWLGSSAELFFRVDDAATQFCITSAGTCQRGEKPGFVTPLPGFRAQVSRTPRGYTLSCLLKDEWIAQMKPKAHLTFYAHLNVLTPQGVHRESRYIFNGAALLWDRECNCL